MPAANPLLRKGYKGWHFHNGGWWYYHSGGKKRMRGELRNCPECECLFPAIKTMSVSLCSTLCAGRAQTGERHHNWKGGGWSHAEGYYEKYAKDGRQILAHRLVMEEFIGRKLLTTESVHHINGNRRDNRIENLQLRQRNHGPGQAWTCRTCGSHDVIATNLADEKENDHVQI